MKELLIIFYYSHGSELYSASNRESSFCKRWENTEIHREILGRERERGGKTSEHTGLNEATQTKRSSQSSGKPMKVYESQRRWRTQNKVLWIHRDWSNKPRACHGQHQFLRTPVMVFSLVVVGVSWEYEWEGLWILCLLLRALLLLHFLVQILCSVFCFILLYFVLLHFVIS